MVRGEAGIGKSAMLAYAVQRMAPGMLVLRAGGVEAESDLAFAGLRELPQPQSAALAGALGLASSTGSDRLLISAAVLGLLAAAAEDRPVLCVVDDAQWIDRPSADALVFAARRPVQVHLAARQLPVRRQSRPVCPGHLGGPVSGETSVVLTCVNAGRRMDAGQHKTVFP